MSSWRVTLPGMGFCEWNEATCDLDSCAYVRKAVESGQWAFVADYIRLQKLDQMGGIYLDTDMEVRKPFEEFLDGARCVLGFEKNGVQAGFIATEPHHPLMRKLLKSYDESVDTGREGHEPKTIVSRLTDLLIDEYGLKDFLHEVSLPDGVRIFPANRFLVDTGDGTCRMVHHYEASWKAEFDAGAFVRDVKRYCDWAHAPWEFRAKERLKMFLQIRFPAVYRRIRDGRCT